MANEQKLAQMWAKLSNDVDFDAALFAKHMDNETPYAQATFVRAGVDVIRNIADKHINGFTHPEYGQAIWAARDFGWVD